jgi:hypothetical protein
VNSIDAAAPQPIGTGRRAATRTIFVARIAGMVFLGVVPSGSGCPTRRNRRLAAAASLTSQMQKVP